MEWTKSVSADSCSAAWSTNSTLATRFSLESVSLGVAVAFHQQPPSQSSAQRVGGGLHASLNCAQLRPLRVPISALEFSGREDLNLRPPGSSASRPWCKS